MIELKIVENHASCESDGENTNVEVAMAVQILADLVAESNGIPLERALVILCATSMATNEKAAEHRERTMICLPRKVKREADDNTI